jgi:hypothetical protein
MGYLFHSSSFFGSLFGLASFISLFLAHASLAWHLFFSHIFA